MSTHVLKPVGRINLSFTLFPDALLRRSEKVRPMHDARLIGAKMQLHGERRVEPRHRIMGEKIPDSSFADRDFIDAAMVGIAIIDISQSGFMALVPRPPAVGEHLVLHVNGLGRVHGNVVWRNDNAIGCKFERRLKAEELETVLSAQSAVII